MDWLAFTFVAAALWGGVSVVDKVIIEKHIPSPFIYSFFLGIYGLVSALMVGTIVPVHTGPTWAILLASLSGTLYLVYTLIYFAAMSRNDVAVVVALGQLTPIFATLWGRLFLGETFGVTTYVGVIIMVLGAMFISVERNKASAGSPFRFSVALWLMVLACVVRSLSDLMLKYPLQEFSTWDGFFWPRLGIFAGVVGVLAFGSGRQRLWTAVKKMGWRLNLLIMASEFTALGAVLAITLAYSRGGPLTLVSASSSIQPLFILLFAWIVNSIRKGTVPNRTDMGLFPLQLLPLSMIALGAYLVGEG